VLWFADPACASEFSLPGDVAANQLDRFASCLAALQLADSARKSVVGDNVLRSAAGIEFVAHVQTVAGDPLLTWIGLAYAGPPILASDAFERLRTSGDRDGTIDAATGKVLLAHAKKLHAKAEGAWVEVCLDTTGAIAKTRVLSASSIAVAQAMLASARTWTFKPFEIGGQPIPVCSLVDMTYPASEHPTTEHLPVPYAATDELVTIAPAALGKRTAGDTLVAPSERDQIGIALVRIGPMDLAYRYCIDETGAVTQVQAVRVSGLHDYDTRLLDTIQRWRYAPYREDGAPTPVCATVTLHYKQQ
jgi:hypothetical protein